MSYIFAEIHRQNITCYHEKRDRQ